MVRVEVRNFQSIAAETVDIAGFSVVVGRSNIGKSALVRAVKAALTGAPVDNYVRHASECPKAIKGAKTCKCFCSVRIVGPDFDLLWEKGDSVNRYVFNGIEHTVVGKGTPEFLGQSFAPIYIGGDSTPTLLQVADQFRPLFILDRSGTAVADVLSDVAKLDQINDAVRAVEKDKRECASTRKVRDKDFKALELALARYEGLDAVLQRVQAVTDMDAALREFEERAAQLGRFVETVTGLKKVLSELEPVADVEIPPVAALVARAQQRLELSRWASHIRDKVAAVSRLDAVATLEVPDIAKVLASADALRRLSRWASQLAVLKGAFAGLTVAESVQVPDISRLSQLQAKLRTMSMWCEHVRGLEQNVARLQNALGVADADEAAVLAGFKELEVCPTCQQPVTKIHVHKGAA